MAKAEKHQFDTHNMIVALFLSSAPPHSPTHTSASFLDLLSSLLVSSRCDSRWVGGEISRGGQKNGLGGEGTRHNCHRVDSLSKGEYTSVLSIRGLLHVIISLGPNRDLTVAVAFRWLVATASATARRRARARPQTETAKVGRERKQQNSLEPTAEYMWDTAASEDVGQGSALFSMERWSVDARVSDGDEHARSVLEACRSCSSACHAWVPGLGRRIVVVSSAAAGSAVHLSITRSVA